MGNNRIFGNFLRYINLLKYKFVFNIPFSFNHLFAKMEDKKKSRLYKKYAEEEGKKR